MPNGTRSETASHTRLTLVTLGAAALRAEGHDESSATTLFELGKPLALITYLACAPERSAAREHLIDLLWGDVETEAAKHALRQTLWYIRKRVADRQLVTGGDELELVGNIESDRNRFVDAVERGDAEDVVRLYTGDFFPGFAAPGGAEFERWADVERHRLRAFFWRSAETLVRRWMSSGKLRDAQALARRVRDTDPLREGGWRLLFETLIAAGDTVGGTLEADAFARLASAESLEPEPSTRAMLRAVRQTPSTTDSPGDRPALYAELVGREQEFSQLLASWDAARAGRATHVHVLAQAGLGKTRLLTDVNARLRATRARTVFVRASLGVRDIPFGFAGDLAEALARLPGASGISTGSARTLVALNPALSASYPAAAADTSADSADTLRRRTVAVRELISVVADEQPVAIFIDDVQWADSRSRQLIAGVVGALENARVLIVTASRPTVDALAAGERSQMIRLMPLDVASVSALVVSIAALPPEPWAERLPADLCAATGGSPLLVLETLQLGIDGGALTRNETGWSSSRPTQLFAALSAGGAVRQRVERLDRTERWALTLLAVAAIPLTTEIVINAAGHSAAEVASALGVLERKGLATRNGDLWTPSHDEIAAVVVELASSDARAAAARSLGRVILDRYPGEIRELRHAGGLLVEARDTASVSTAFARFARLARHAGDSQPNRALANDFLGERATPELIGQIVRRLPWAHRSGLYSLPRQVTLAVIGVAVPLGLLASRHLVSRPVPDVVLAIGDVGLDSAARLYRIPIRAAELGPGSRVRVGVGSPTWKMRLDPSYPTLVRTPDDKGWSIDRVSPDSGGIDVFEISDDGAERRLSAARGDDQSASWSPDGRFVAFLTARWNAQSHYDLAVLDRTTGATRSLTLGPNSDTGPIWSPDGSRIAFTRTYWDGRQPQVCTVDFDAQNERCFPSGEVGMRVLPAWYDTRHVIVDWGRAPRFIGRLDIVTGATDTLLSLGKDDVTNVSPDGRWMICRCRRLGYSADAVLLFPMDDPNRVIELDLSALRNQHRVFAFAEPLRGSRRVDRLAISHGLGAPIVGQLHNVSAVGVSPNGDIIPVGSLRWASHDTTVATIDRNGVLFPRLEGTVRIEVTAGGWRSAYQYVTIRPNTSRVLKSEDWTTKLEQSWVPFGDPRPQLDTATDGVPAFRNNGDGNFSSGVYSRARFPTADGLALDLWISNRVTKDQWQIVQFSLDDALTEAGLQRWDHKNGSLPRTEPDPPACGGGFPAAEGLAYGDSANVIFGRGESSVATVVPRSFRSGTWFHVRAQIFPDGRCGIAFNGRPVGISQAPVIPDSAVRVVISGNSDETKALVGPVTIRTGVPTDIDWSRIGQPVPNAPPAGWSPRHPR